jgi:UDP-N-acetylglucosamine 2-epimerase
MIEFMESTEKKFFVITAANKDDGGVEINDRMRDWAMANPHRSKFYYHLGSLDYFNLLIHANCLLGNSSSGLTEAAILNVPVVNIGDRQLGRHKEGNVYDCDFAIDEITKQYWNATRKLSENSQNKLESNLISPSKLIIDFLNDYFSKSVNK